MLRNIPSEQLDDIVAKVKDRVLAHGLCMRTSEAVRSSETVNYAPFALFPMRISKAVFDQAVSLQPHYNVLMHRAAEDHQFLYDSLKEAIEVDEFVKNQWEVYLKSRDSPHTQPISLLLSRSDYMIDCKHQPAQLKQIEFNTISSGFHGLMSRLPDIQRFALDVTGSTDHHATVADSPGQVGAADGLLQSWTIYAQPKAAVLMVVEEDCRNIMDQRYVEWSLYDMNRSIPFLRRTFSQLHTSASVDAQGRLFVDGYEVAVVYYRTGYIPTLYNSHKDWDLRATLECTRAIKCPSIQSQLSGSKKIQQVLAVPGMVERFIPDPQVAAQLRRTFAGLYTLDLTEEGDAAVTMAMASDNFVMKPQREGGGNNIYGRDVGEMLTKVGRSVERCQYILMERLHPEVQQNVLFMAHKTTTVCPTISELGIFGALIGSADKIHMNAECGYLTRTKNVGVDEGGVSSGFAALSAAILV